MINVIDLHKSFGGNPAVKGLTFEVQPGELFGFLGPNGAGKTTTMRLLATLLKPTSGTAVVAGCDVLKDPDGARRALGYLAETPYFYPKLTGAEFVEFTGRLYGVEPEVVLNRRKRLFEVFELAGSANKLVESYSQGMKQKLALAALLVHEPQVLLLDEPTNGLDPRAARTVKELLRALCERGRTVFMSTHLLEVAEQMCDRVGILYQGELVVLGKPEELRAKAKGGSLEQVFLEVTGGVETNDLASLLDDEVEAE